MGDNFQIKLDVGFSDIENLKSKLKNVVDGLNNIANKQIQLDVGFKNSDFTQQLNQLNSLVQKSGESFKNAFNIDTGKLQQAIGLTEQMSKITGLTPGTHNADVFGNGTTEKLIRQETEVKKLIEAYESMGYKVSIANKEAFTDSGKKLVSDAELNKLKTVTLELEKQDGILHKMTYSRPTVANGAETPFTLTNLKSTDNSAELIKAQQKALADQEKAQQKLANETEKANKQRIAEEQEYQKEIEKTVALMTKQIDAMTKNNILPDSDINSLRNQVSGLSVKSDETEFARVSQLLDEMTVKETEYKNAINNTQERIKKTTQEQIARGKATYDLIAQEQKVEQEQQKMSETASQYAQKTSIALDNLKTKYGSSVPVKELNDLKIKLESIKNLSIGGKPIESMEQLKRAIKETQIEYAKLDSETRKSAGGLMGTLSHNLQSFASFYVGIGGIMAAFNAIKSGVQDVVEMDNALVDLNKVVDMSKSQMNEMKESAIDMGIALGQSSTDIMSGMAEFGRVTKNLDEIKELTKVATMAGNVTDMSVAEASKALNTAMITFKINAKDSMSILDSWNEIKCVSPYAVMCM